MGPGKEIETTACGFVVKSNTSLNQLTPKPMAMQRLTTVPRLIYRVLRRAVTLDIAWLMMLERGRVPPPRETHQGHAASLLTTHDVELLAENAENDLPAELASRLTDSRNFCVGLFVDGELASYAWFALDSIEAEHNRGANPATGVGFTFPPNVAFMYKGFTVPRFRGRGLYGTIPQHALELLSEHGVTSILSTADWSNSAALSSCERIGFFPIGRVWVLGLNRFVLRGKPTAAAKLGIA